MKLSEQRNFKKEKVVLGLEIWKVLQQMRFF
jgi:hypothetical protein